MSTFLHTQTYCATTQHILFFEVGNEPGEKISRRLKLLITHTHII